MGGRDMTDLAELVSTLISVERVGGRVQRVGMTKLLVLDCMHWSQDFTDSVTRLFPDVGIDVCSNRQSLSGFTVGLTWHGGGRVDVVLYVAIAGGLACCIYTLFTSPWWGVYRLAYFI
jgi:hypothetical protein